MAKITARGAREVARWETFIVRQPDNAGDDIERIRFLIVLTSDGRVLRRLADGGLSGGYTVLATFKPNQQPPAGTPKPTPAELVELRRARVERFLGRRGYVDVARQTVRA